MKNYLLKLLPALALFFPFTVMAMQPGEGIVLDPNTGDYLINYLSFNKQLMQSRFAPSTKIDPTLRSRFENKYGLIRYSYIIHNGIKGKQPLIGLELEPVSSVFSNAIFPKTWHETDQVMKQLETNPTRIEQMVNEANSVLEKPNGWGCRVIPIGNITGAGFRISCSFDNLDDAKRNGLQIGETQTGFGFASVDLPGIGEGRLSGFGDIGPGFLDEGPRDNEIRNQLNELQLNDFVSRNAVIPTIAVPVPYDAAVLLDGIRAQMLTWSGKQLLDPAFATQLDRYMIAAANAYRSNQPKAGKENIESVRKLLEHEHRYLDHDEEDNEDTAERKAATRLTIDRLAARVLDFDLRYVLKRMEHEHDEGDGRKGRD